MTFEALGLSPEILKALTDLGHHAPTPIQKQSIPHVLDGRDLLGIAQTGTGKTGGFLLPVLHKIAEGKRHGIHIRALVMSPTRELAGQIHQAAKDYSKYLHTHAVLLVGGVDFARQERNLRRPWDLIVATPGRLLDHIRRRNLTLSRASLVIIDEADRMLDMGFLPDIQTIVDFLPKGRQSLLFSATCPPRIQELATSFQNDAVIVRVDPEKATADKIQQEWITVAHGSQKLGLLKKVLGTPDEGTGQVIIFTRTKRGAEDLSVALSQAGFPTDALHGDKSQPVRNRVLGRFRRGELKVLVATDVAARGLDIDGITHVINYDLPQTAEDYVHRIGRTGRAGKSGRALSFFHPGDREIVQMIETLTGKTIPHSPLSVPLPEGGARRSFGGGRRPGGFGGGRSRNGDSRFSSDRGSSKGSWGSFSGHSQNASARRRTPPGGRNGLPPNDER
jgi:ATP-dependent RNA helicase RhlE